MNNFFFIFSDNIVYSLLLFLTAYFYSDKAISDNDYLSLHTKSKVPKQYNKHSILLFMLFCLFFAADSPALAEITNVKFDIIVPLNSDYDDYPLKKFEAGDVIDKPHDGEYYYPALTYLKGSGAENISDGQWVPASDEVVSSTYYLSSDGTINNYDTSGVPFARIYRLNYQIKSLNYDSGNVKFKMSYISEGEGGDIVHEVVDSSGAVLTISPDGGVINADETECLVVVNALDRIYNSESGSTFQYYQGTNSLQLYPTDPKNDGNWLTLFDSAGTPVETLPLNASMEDYDVTVECKLRIKDAVYYDYYKNYISTGEQELKSIEAVIRPTNGGLTYSFTDSNPDLEGKSYFNFKFTKKYSSLLASGSDTFDITFTGSTSTVEYVNSDQLDIYAGDELEINSSDIVRTAGEKDTLTLSSIKLPKATLNSLTISNNTTATLWTSLGVSNATYSNTTFDLTGFSDGIISKTGDGNYAKTGDDISIKLDYTTNIDGDKYTLDKTISLLYGTEILNLSDIDNDNIYSAALGSFTGNGAAYLVFKNVADASTVGSSGMIEALYIDNLDPNTEIISATKQYINNSAYYLEHSSSEEGRGSDYSLEDLTTGYTGTRAYIDIFSYNNSESDIQEFDPGISTVPYTGSALGTKYYNVILGYSDDILIDSIGHKNDGGYHINKVMAIDKAGNVEAANKTDLATILSEVDYTTEVYDYYIDTISPIITASLQKTADLYPDLDSVFGLPAELPFKFGDQLKLSLKVIDYNLNEYSLDDSSIYLTNSYSFPLLNTAELTFTVQNPTTDSSGSNYEFFTATAEDKAGNSSTVPITGELINTAPSDLAMQLYEEHWDWQNSATYLGGDSTLQDPDDYLYRFSKGARRSGSLSPDAYITGTAYDKIDDRGDDKVQILSVDINGDQIYYDHGNLTPSDPHRYGINLSDINYYDPNIDDFYLSPNSKNIIKATPYGVSGVKGNEYMEKIVIDTDINSTNTIVSHGVYSAASETYKFELDFSSIAEFAGLKGYKVNKIIAKSGNNITTTYDNSSSTTYEILPTIPSTKLKTTSGLVSMVELDKSYIKPGTRSILYADVVDGLGSKMQLEFTLLTPEPSVKLTAKTKSSEKKRVSHLKVVGENYDNYGFKVYGIQEAEE